MRLWLEAGDGFIRSREHLFRKFLCEVGWDEQVRKYHMREAQKTLFLRFPAWVLDKGFKHSHSMP